MENAKKNISDHLERRRTPILRGDDAQRQNWGAADETSNDLAKSQ
jgi:hypothetical protein